MNETRRDGDMVYFDFVCEGCKAEGELGLDMTEGMKPFGCPEGCGATYVPWMPDGHTYVLKCVVEPFFLKRRKRA